MKSIQEIDAAEQRLKDVCKAAIRPKQPMFLLDLFLLGAAKRTLAQSKGFRMMIVERNFPCAAILLRTQIDTAMRINGIKYLENPNEQLLRLMKGETNFGALFSNQKGKKGKALQMQDAFLRERLQESEPWIENVYRQTSDFVHLSFRHFFQTIRSTDDESMSFEIELSDQDQTEKAEDYLEVCNAFLAATHMTIDLIEGLFRELHTPEQDQS